MDKQESSQTKPAEKNILAGKRVLIVQDVEDIAQHLEESCTDWGAIEVCSVYDSEAALAKMILEPPYDLAIIEVILAPNAEISREYRNLVKFKHDICRQMQELGPIVYGSNNPEAKIHEEKVEQLREDFADASERQSYLFQFMNMEGLNLVRNWIEALEKKFGFGFKQPLPILFFTTQDDQAEVMLSSNQLSVVVSKPASVEEIRTAIIDLFERDLAR